MALVEAGESRWRRGWSRGGAAREKSAVAYCACRAQLQATRNRGGGEEDRWKGGEREKERVGGCWRLKKSEDADVWVLSASTWYEV